MLLVCSFISCVIIVSILFQFLNDRFIKAYNNKYLYQFLAVSYVIIIMIVNMSMNPILNSLVNIILFGFISGAFYYEEGTGKFRFTRILETEALFAVAIMSEALGVFLIDILISVMKVTPGSVENQLSIETVFSKIILLFFYYVIFSRLWTKSIVRTKEQYILYLVMFTYSIINIFIVAAVSDKTNPVILFFIVGGTIFANMYLLYFIKYSDERNYYKLQVDMMEQQEKLLHSHYEIQREKYLEARMVLHDVDKHIKMIERLYDKGLKNETLNYMKEISHMLRPLLPENYTENPFLNCLLSDKIRSAEKSGIRIEADIQSVDFNFMKPIEITAIFENLLDNAMEASTQCRENKYIGIYAENFNEMLAIRVENSVCKPVLIKNGKLVNASIGIRNIQRYISLYEGWMTYKNIEDKLVCDIILNRV